MNTKRNIPFIETLRANNIVVSRGRLSTVQINMGARCDQTCTHCHVEGGPDRVESMGRETVGRILALLAVSPGIATVDITGGAPELNPHFRELVIGVRSLGKTVVDRCNLRVLTEEGQRETAVFLRDHGVRIVASLPCYTEPNVDSQRGSGAFAQSIRALTMLNALGYGCEQTGLILDLVSNPLDGYLPGSQAALESDYRINLRRDQGIEFNRLLTITNMPIGRFLRLLNKNDSAQKYLNLLVANFNPRAAESVMCTSLISIGWDGRIYDCDFNQVLGIPIGGTAATIDELRSFDELADKDIAFGDHCYGCTAGEGSSCGGALDDSGVD